MCGDGGEGEVVREPRDAREVSRREVTGGEFHEVGRSGSGHGSVNSKGPGSIDSCGYALQL